MASASIWRDPRRCAPRSPPAGGRAGRARRRPAPGRGRPRRDRHALVRERRQPAYDPGDRQEPSRPLARRPVASGFVAACFAPLGCSSSVVFACLGIACPPHGGRGRRRRPALLEILRLRGYDAEGARGAGRLPANDPPASSSTRTRRAGSPPESEGVAARPEGVSKVPVGIPQRPTSATRAGRRGHSCVDSGALELGLTPRQVKEAGSTARTATGWRCTPDARDVGKEAGR